MSKEKRNSILWLICIFLLCASIPFRWFIKNEDVVYYLSMSCRLAFFAYYFIYLKKEKLHTIKIDRPHLKDLLFIPFIVISCSNFIYVKITNCAIYDSIDKTAIIKDLFLYILVGIGEELVFREVLLGELLKVKKPLVAILYSSLIFGAVHLLNISSFASIPICLVQSVYTFGVGLVFGLIYYQSTNVIYPIILHIMFDFINDSLVTNMYVFDWDIWFFVVNIAVAIVVLLYGVLLFYLHEKRKRVEA